MTVRSYQPSDLDAVWELHNMALKATGAHLGNGSWDRDLRDIPNVYLQNKGCFLIGQLDERIIAMGALKCTDLNRAEIKRMRVHPDFQRHGYGTKILNALETEARRLGYDVLHLNTTTLQTAAQKMYENHGYHQVGTSLIGGFNTLLYEKKLPESNYGFNSKS